MSEAVCRARRPRKGKSAWCQRGLEAGVKVILIGRGERFAGPEGKVFRIDEEGALAGPSWKWLQLVGRDT